MSFTMSAIVSRPFTLAPVSESMYENKCSFGVIVSGAVCAKHDDGTELTYKAGDAYSIDPGHDGWVVGDEPAVVYEFHGKWGE